MKYFEVNVKPQFEVGYKIGNLTVCSLPYYKYPSDSGKHRRQFFDCKCDCGNIKEFVLGKGLQNGNGVLLYCSRNCDFYLKNMPFNVPEYKKKCKLGEIYNYLTITKEAFYHQLNNEINRHKCVEVQCKCGNIRIYREDKVYSGKYKSCGCVWEHSFNKKKNWDHIEKKYGLSKNDYELLLHSQNGTCAICKSSDSQTSLSKWLFVDHCHKTGKIRGLLCNKCNSGLGAFDENIDVINNSIEYLLKHIDKK